MKKLLIKLCLAAAMFKTQVAAAEADTFGLGTGRDGALVVANSATPINRYALVTSPLAPRDTVIPVANSAGFAAGDLVMVLQSTSAVLEPASGQTAPLELPKNSVGTFELARVDSVSGPLLVLTAPLVHSYASSVTQVVRVPEYTTVEVSASGRLEAAPWDGSTGGVLAFLATGTVTNEGRLSVSGAGFRGAQASATGSDALGCQGLDESAPLGAQKGEGVAATRFGRAGRGSAANAGGGGVCLMSGGGGGGNGGAGGQGGRSNDALDGAREVGGQGGVKVVFEPLEQLAFGGGGGAGHVGIVAASTDSDDDGTHSGRGHDEHGNGNGNGHCKGKGNGHDEDECEGATTGIGGNAGGGGGILFVRAAKLEGTGVMEADGATGGDGVNSGGSGGGAGGLISARFSGSAVCGAIHANGGMGGYSNSAPAHSGPGGGGGGGWILFQSSTQTCELSVAGGAPGSARGSIGIDPHYGAQGAEDGTIHTMPGGYVPERPSANDGGTTDGGTTDGGTTDGGSCGDYMNDCGPQPEPQVDSLFLGGGVGCTASGTGASMMSLLLLLIALGGARKQ